MAVTPVLLMGQIKEAWREGKREALPNIHAGYAVRVTPWES